MSVGRRAAATEADAMTDRQLLEAEARAAPNDFARCRGRQWPEDTFLAPECQECERWVAHFTDGRLEPGAIVAHIEPTNARPCPTQVRAAAAMAERGE